MTSGSHNPPFRAFARMPTVCFASVLIAFWAATASFPCSATPGTLRIRGYFKSFFSALRPPVLGHKPAPPVEGSVQAPLRLKAFWRASGTVSAEFAYEATPQVQGARRALAEIPLPQLQPLAYRVWDLRAYLYPFSGTPEGSFVLAQNLDRALLSIAAPAADFYIGRQAVAFGSARVVNPTDVIAPFTYETLDKEERPGVDALRARIPVGTMGEIDAGIVFGGDFSLKAGAAFLRGRGYWKATDFSAIAMLARENLMLGVDAARALGGAGAWLEAAWTLPDAIGDASPGRGYLRLSAGADYNFSGGIYAFIEYHFNGAGAAEAKAYVARQQEAPYTRGGVYLMGRHYAAPGVIYQITPLTTLAVQALVNLTDASAFLAPKVEYSFAEDVVLEAGVFYGLGRGPGAQARDRVEIEPRSEFGLYPDIFFTSFRVYF